MKKITWGLLGGLLLLLFLATLAFLIYKARKPAVVYDSARPVVMDIVQKTVTTGSIVPRKEIAVKSRISGIVNEVYVEPGEAVEAGDPIISLKVVPDNLNLNKAELELARARIAYQKSQREVERQKGLYASKVVPDAEYEKYTVALELAKEDLAWAENNLLLIREGASEKSGQVSNVIFSPSAGMVLEVPVKPGGSVMESSSFNEGTTIASVADMGNLVFEGQLDESEIGKVRPGMELIITVAALTAARLSARLDYIAPKGAVNQGSVQFQIKAAVQPPQGLLLRAGYSASADIVLGKAEKALAVQERDVLFEGDRTFVEVRTGSNRYSKREVTLGLSDGIYVEIKSGLSAGESVKVQSPATGARPSS